MNESPPAMTSWNICQIASWSAGVAGRMVIPLDSLIREAPFLALGRCEPGVEIEQSQLCAATIMNIHAERGGIRGWRLHDKNTAIHGPGLGIGILVHAAEQDLLRSQKIPAVAVLGLAMIGARRISDLETLLVRRAGPG